MFGRIYIIRNKVNGKIYIGQTILSLTTRWRCHIADLSNNIKTRCLLNAIRKYGKDSFSIEQLCEAGSQEELNSLEISYIQRFKSYPPQLGFGYNMTPGGYGGSHNKPHTQESKDKVSKANKGRKRTAEQRIQHSLRMKAERKEHPITWGDKISATLKAKGIKPPGGKVGTKQGFRSSIHRERLSLARHQYLVMKEGFYGS